MSRICTIEYNACQRPSYGYKQSHSIISVMPGISMKAPIAPKQSYETCAMTSPFPLPSLPGAAHNQATWGPDKSQKLLIVPAEKVTASGLERLQHIKCYRALKHPHPSHHCFRPNEVASDRFQYPLQFAAAHFARGKRGSPAQASSTHRSPSHCS